MSVNLDPLAKPALRRRRRRPRAVAATALPAMLEALEPRTLLSGAFPIAPIALRDQQVPGLPAGYVYNNIDQAVIGGGSFVALSAAVRLIGQNIDADRNHVLVAGAPGSLLPYMVSGPAVPAGDGTVGHRSDFRDLIAAGSSASFISRADSTTEVYALVNGAMHLVLADGQTSPNNVTITNAATSDRRLNESGQVYIPFFAGKDQLVWTDGLLEDFPNNPTSPTPQDPEVPQPDSDTFADGGRTLAKPPFSGAGGIGLLTVDGPYMPLATQGDAAPGTGGTFFGTFYDLDLSDSGVALFAALVRLPSGQFLPGSPIFAGTPGNLTLVVNDGDPVPGTGATIDINITGVPNYTIRGSSILLQALLQGPGVTSANNDAILTTAVGGPLRLVAREGDAAPDTEAGTTFVNLSSAVINANGTVAFSTQLKTAGGAITQALYATDPSGNARLVARTGMAIAAPAAPGGVITPTSFSVYSHGFNGQETYLSDTGQLLFVANSGNVFMADVSGVVPPASIGDRAFVDEDADGVQDAGEPGLAGVTVQLFRTTDGVAGNGDDVLAGTQVTGGDGLYQFAGFEPGQYYVRFTGPAGFARTIANAGGNDALDSDADAATGNTSVFTVAAGIADASRDAGFVDNADHAPPSVTVVDSPNILVAGLPFYTFDVTFADPSGVDVEALFTSGVVVRGPQGFQVTAGVVDVDVETNGSPRKATYVISAPVVGTNGDGSPRAEFLPYHNGTYTLSLLPGQIMDTLGNAAAAEQVIGEFNVVIIDAQPPGASLETDPLDDALFLGSAQRGDPTVDLNVTFFDGSGIDVNTISAGMLLLRSAGGDTISSNEVIPLSLNAPFDGKWRFAFPAPGGALDEADEGSWDLILKPDRVRDLVGNVAAAETVIGEVIVDFTSPAAVLRANPVTAPGATAYFFEIDWLDPAGVDVDKLTESTLAPVVIQFPGTGAVSEVELINVPGTNQRFEYLAGDGDRRAVRTYFRFTPPGGAWDEADEGTYRVVGISSRIGDDLGNAAAAAAQIGTFEVRFGEPIEIGGDTGFNLLEIGDDVNQYLINIKNASASLLVTGQDMVQTLDVRKKKISIKGVDVAIGDLLVFADTSIGRVLIKSQATKILKKIAVGKISIFGSLGSFIAPALALSDSLIVNGTAKLIELGTVKDDHLIQIGPPDNPGDTVAIKFGEVANTDIISQTPIKSLTVTEWIDDDGDADQITAPWVGSVTVNGDKAKGLPGDFAAALLLDGQGAPKGVALGAVKVAGDIVGGAWQVAGAGSTISARSTAAAWSANFAGGLKSVTTNLDLAGQLTAAAIASITVKRDARNLQLTLTNPPDPDNERAASLGKFSVKRLLENSIIRSAGAIGSAAVGAMFGSSLLAGVSAAETALPDFVGDFATFPIIKSFKVAGLPNEFNASFVDSIVAAWEIGSATIVAPMFDNGGTPFGLAAHSIASVTVKDPLFGFSARDLAPVISTVPAIDDFEARVV